MGISPEDRWRIISSDESDDEALLIEKVSLRQDRRTKQVSERASSSGAMDPLTDTIFM